MCRREVCVMFFVLTALAVGLPSKDQFTSDFDASVVRETRAVGPDSIDDLLGPVCAILGVASYVAGAPVKYELESKTKSHITITLPENGDLINFNILQDILESVQDAFFHTYGDDKADDGDVQGYSKKSDDDGEDGYKHFDSYHKKDGDKYAFEKHSEYGQGNNHEADADGHSGKLQESVEYEDDDDGEESKDSYQVIKHTKEGHRERRQAADDDDDDYESGERRRRRGRYRASDEDDDEPRYRGNDDDDDDY